MDYTSIHIYGHLLSDDILHSIERDQNLMGNREQDFSIDISTSAAIDYVWSSLRNDWRFYKERSGVNDPYGTRRSRELMERLFQSIGYSLVKQTANVEVGGRGFEISHLCPDLANMPMIVVGEKVVDEGGIDTLDKCSLDYRAKGARRKKSPHATMLEYLNATENVYGIVSNGATIRLLRNSGQLVKLTYIEFDLRRMLEEDKYAEFCLMFRLLHASRFRADGDEPCVMERWFNMSIESGNRIRNGLSAAVQKAMETIGNTACREAGEGNETLRKALAEGSLQADGLNKELIHFIYRLLFLFIIEDRNLVYQIPDDADGEEYKRICRWQEIYKHNYAASRFRRMSELAYLRQRQYHDLWQSLMDTFRLFEDGNFGGKMGISPLGGILFNKDTLHYLKSCRISNRTLLEAFAALNEFTDERGMTVKINYSSLDVEEFGSVYEGILEMRPFVLPAVDATQWQFGYVGGLDRQSTSSYYTRPDLVQNLIRTTLEPVIKERIAKLSTPEEKVKSLLSMKVCDAASGSGHIVLAMARTIAWYVCSIRTGEDNPASQDYRQALREVIQRCVYAVDYNPDAVELCKVVLWIEGYCAGKPLSFLDHHIRCGNSVVGVSNLQMLIDGVPDKALTAEDKDALRAIRKLNAATIKAMHGEETMPGLGLEDAFGVDQVNTEQIDIATKVMLISHLPEDTLEQEQVKQQQWERLMDSTRVKCLRRACDIYTYAFYRTTMHNEVLSRWNDYSEEELQLEAEVPYTKTVVRALQEMIVMDGVEKGKPVPTYYNELSRDFKSEVLRASMEHRFFHWAIEFPEVFAANKGFDVMCGNPPWDKIKVEDKKWFESQGRADIVNAGTAAQRKKAIANLPTTDPELYQKYTEALANAEAQSRFVRLSGRFNLTATGDIDLYPMFAELCLTFSKEAWGLVLPIGLATNDSNKEFFKKLIVENRLKSIYCFENKERLFEIDSTTKFMLLTVEKSQEKSRLVNAGFYLTRIDHLLDPKRLYELNSDEIIRFNPNTKTCPVFRTSRDAALTAKIYRHSTILINEYTGDNPWNVKFARMLDMSNDSHLFRTYAQLMENEGKWSGNTIQDSQHTLYTPLYEGKMIYLYNHHYGINPLEGEHPNNASLPLPTIAQLQNPNFQVVPYYWIEKRLVEEKLKKRNRQGEVIWEWTHKSFLAFKDVGRSGVARTFIISRIPDAFGVGHTATLLFAERGCMPELVLQGMLSSIVLDYVARQKAGGNHMSTFIVKQFPVLTHDQIPAPIQWQIVKRVAELCYFNHDLDGWAEELWEEMNEEQRAELPQLGDKQPWIFNPDRRALLQAELDAIFAHLYGLTTEDLRYILDPEDVCGESCINETFRVLKDNELRQYGEYRTKRLVLDAWNRFGYDN